MAKYTLVGDTVVATTGKGEAETITLSELGERDYSAYRTLTGKCEICGEIIVSHLRCKSCTILIGTGHLEDYLENERCSWCISHGRR